MNVIHQVPQVGLSPVNLSLNGGMVSPPPSRDCYGKCCAADVPALVSLGRVRSVASATTSTAPCHPTMTRGTVLANAVLPWAMDFLVYGTGLLEFLGFGRARCAGVRPGEQKEAAQA